ncbi:MAG: flagellar basal-body rod protein FlgG [Phycisphaerales bacterium]
MAIIALQSASSGLNALSTKLDVIANNLANVETTGFKTSRVNFQDQLYIERMQPGVENANGDQRPTGLYVGLGVKVSGTQVDFDQGAPIVTNRPLDLTIDGAGFFQVAVEEGLSGEGTAYTRYGAFALNAEGGLVLATDQGRQLDPSVTIPDDATAVDIDSEGRVFATIPGSVEPQEVGQLQIATFVNPAGLRQVGENLWVESAASGPPSVGNPAEDQRGRIRQGQLEGSNVDPTRELVELIRTQRAFEMNSQSIRAADDALQTVAQLRR